MNSPHKLKSSRVESVDKSRWGQLSQQIEKLTATDQVSAIALKLDIGDNSPATIFAGRTQLDSTDETDEKYRLTKQSLFHIASVTKPIFATAVLILVERGLVSLTDRISNFFPEFRSGGKRTVTIRHLLTHTSGIPDMLPTNLELRRDNAPLTEFWKQTAESKLEFSPGTEARYSSMGFVVLDKIIQLATGISSQQFLAQEIFTPLGMHDTFLGIPDNTPETEMLLKRAVEVKLEDRDENPKGDWNSRYWRTFGAPWGGMFSTADDVSKFGKMILQNGRYTNAQGESQSILSPQTIDAATANQLNHFETINQRDPTHRGWGFGWRLNWVAHRYTFGDMLANEVVGHWGASGCLMWIDRYAGHSLVLCTTQPTNVSLTTLIRLSNQAAATIVTR